MITNADELDAALMSYQFVDTTGRIILTAEFQAIFHFWDGHLRSKLRALETCMEAYKQRYGEHLTWGFDPKGWKQKPLNKLPSLTQYIEEQAVQNDTVEWYVSSGEQADPQQITDEEAGEYVLQCMTSRDWETQESSYLRMRISRYAPFEAEDWPQLKELFDLCLEQLQPVHAYAGLQAATPYEAITVEQDSLKQALACAGIYQDTSAWETTQIKNGIKSIDWLTFVDDSFTERVGGPKKFTGYCEQFGVTPQRIANGFLIQTTPYPQILPVKESIPNEYIKINAALRPLRNGRYGALASGAWEGERKFDHTLSDLWARRFDQKGLWPPKFPLAKETRPEPPIYLKSGDTCTHSGRYRYSDQKDIEGKPTYVENPDRNAYALDAIDQRQQVILLKGDLVPYFVERDQHGHFVKRRSIKWELVSQFTDEPVKT